MAELVIEPFTRDDVVDAGELLARQVVELRRQEPLLPAGYEQSVTAADAVGRLFGRPDASGMVARQDRQLVGYLVGAPRPDFPGPNVWVMPEGQVAADSAVLAALYAHLADEWVSAGRTAHYALVPACDAASVGTWFRMCFGLQHVHAATELAVWAPTAPAAHVRRATGADLERLVDFDRQMCLHLARTPVFSAVKVPDVAEASQDWSDSLADDRQALFVVEHDGRVAGAAIGCPVEMSSAHAGLARPDEAAMLAWIVVDAAARGRGLSRPLASTVLDWAHENGYGAIVTDWRSANLESARSWRRFGFRDTLWRMHRVVGY